MSGKTKELSERPVFENLTGLRFVGALMVFLFHCFTLYREIWGGFSSTKPFEIVANIAGKGHLGINLFFTLSGFLITYLLLWEQKASGKVNLANFLMRRTLRIWPLYFLIVIFGFFIFPNLPYGIQTVHEFWRYAIFLSNIDEVLVGMNDSINFLSATWSVSVEEQFYIAWAGLLLVSPLLKRRMHLLFFVLIILGSLIFRFLNLENERVLYFHSFSVMSDLAFGCLIAYLVFHDKLKNTIRKLTKGQLLLIYLIGSSLLVFDGYIIVGYLKVIERIIPSLFFGFIILEQVFSSRSLFKVDKLPFFRRSGEISYGFYMFHCISLYYCSILFSELNLTDNLWHFALYILLAFTSTYTVSALSYRYFEKPILRLKKFFK